MTAVPRREAAGSSHEPFLPTLPSRWRVQRLKHAARVIPSNVDKHTRGDEIPVRLCNYTDVYYNQLITSDLDLMAATATPSQLRTFGLRAGDTIVTKDSETADDIAIPAFVPEMLPRVVCGYHLSIVRPRSGVDGRFLSFLFQSRFVRARVETLARGLTRVGLMQHALDNLSIPIPPLDEQRRIAAFLDHETRRINALQGALTTMAQLAQERYVVQTRARLTGAHNAADKVRTSGAPWLASLPSHWELVALRHLASITTGSRDTQDRRVDGGYPFYVRSMQVEQIDTYSFDEEAVLTSGDGAGVGEVFHHVVGRFELHQRMYALTRFRRVTGRYLFYFLRSFFKLQMTQWNAKSTVDSVRLPFLKSMLVAVPPPDEQAEIVASLDRASLVHESWESDRSKLADLLAERRSALVTAAVTGQIDLREWRPGEAQIGIEGVESS